MKPDITKEELNIIKEYQSKENSIINQLFIENAENDISLLQDTDWQYSNENLIESINKIKSIFEIIIKNSDKKEDIFYKSTSISEIDSLKINSLINQFFIAKSNKEIAKNEIANNWNRPVIMQIKINNDVTWINLEDEEILVSPFTKVKNIQEYNDDSDLNMYQIELEPQELTILSEEEKDTLYDSIVERTNEINEKLKVCVELDNENTIHYENIRKLEQLLANHHYTMEQPNYEQDTSDEEKQSDLDDIARINLELNSIKERATNIFNIRKEYSDFISRWKKDIIVYLENEFREIQEKKEENIEIEEKNIVEIIPQISEEPIKELEPEIAIVKQEALENIAIVNTLLNNIKELITKQQNHARIAESIDSNYKALNNAFSMKNYAEELDVKLQTISNKIDTLSLENKEELDKISKVNIQISTLLNYLNNAKAAVGKKITRFDEISIIEENELKKEIAETIKNIRCEAELKKLRDDVEIIEDKSSFQKFVGRFTGRNKLDKTMLDQIQIRQSAIRKTFKTKMPLSYNYSIHEMIAEIEMFIEENEDDELVIEDIDCLRKIKDTLKKHFVIIDSKVVSIIDQKTGKNLPLTSKKLTKKELIEIDTYRFLNRYGYDKSNDVNEPEYQDTMANEIKQIVDYIKTSGVI